MMDAIELLRRDHDEARRLLSELRELIAACRAHHEFEGHPDMPPDPEVQRLADRIAGATDRIRDVLAGRTGI